MNSTAIAAASIAISASGSNDLSELKCASSIHGYQHNTATIDQRKEYSDCVDNLYQDPMTPAAIMFFKIVIIFAMAGAIVGLWPSENKGFIDYVLLGLVCAIFGACIPFLISFIVMAVNFLFTA